MQTAKRVNKYNSLKSRGVVKYDTAKSRTNDGSGVLDIPATSGSNHLVALPALDNNSYYALNMWIKAEADGVSVRLFKGPCEVDTTSAADFTITTVPAGDW